VEIKIVGKTGRELKFSYSRVTEFKNCKRRAALARLYKPKVKALKLEEGTIVHKCLESMYKADASWKRHLSESEEYVKKLPELDQFKARQKLGMIEPVLDYYYQQVVVPDLRNYDIVEQEVLHEFEILDHPVIGKVNFVLKPDAVWRHRSKNIRFLVEYKYMLQEPSIPFLDFQIGLYTLGLLPEYGMLPTMYQVIYKPKFEMGKKDADLPSFLARVREDIPDPDFSYGDGVEFSCKRFSRRIYSRSREELAITLDDVRRTIIEMVTGFEDTRNPSGDCSWKCQFLRICFEENPVLVDSFYDRIV
jgi:hypothetical protein